MDAWGTSLVANEDPGNFQVALIVDHQTNILDWFLVYDNGHHVPRKVLVSRQQ
jgi:hypothetical protein